MSDLSTTPPPDAQQPDAQQPDAQQPDVPPAERFDARLVRWLVVLILANVMVDTVIVAPNLVLPQMLDFFQTDKVAWLGASAMLAGAMWAPLLGRSADIHGHRTMLTVALSVGCLGGLVCLLAPNIWVFVAGRLLQGAAVAAVFLTVALVRRLCAPRIAMTAVGIVTSGSAALGMVTPFFFEAVSGRFGFRSVFVVSATLAALSAVCVRLFVPQPAPVATGRVDVRGAALLGAGLAAVLTYVSLGPDFGWAAPGPLALLGCGLAALAGWAKLARSTPEPVLDVRDLTRPIALTLLVVVLGTGAYQSLLQLIGLIARVHPEQGLGYGLAGEPGALGLMFALPAVGVMFGGSVAGWLAGRVGPAWTLLGGIGISVLASFGFLLSTSSYAPAVVCKALLGVAAGAIMTSGFNLVTSEVSPRRQGVVASLVQVMVGIGSVAFNVLGGALLESTAIVVRGETVNSAVGVHGYVAMTAVAFVLAALVALLLTVGSRANGAEPGAR